MIRFVVYLAALLLLALIVAIAVTPVLMVCNWLFNRDDYPGFQEYRRAQGQSDSKLAFAFWYNNPLDRELYAVLSQREGQPRRKLMSLGPTLLVAVLLYVGILLMLMGPTVAV